jgi:hypothetical protein
VASFSVSLPWRFRFLLIDVLASAVGGMRGGGWVRMREADLLQNILQISCLAVSDDELGLWW